MSAEFVSVDHPANRSRRTALAGDGQFFIAGLTHLQGHLPMPQSMEHRSLDAFVTLGTNRSAVLAVEGPLLLIIDCVMLVHLPSTGFANHLAAAAVAVNPVMIAQILSAADAVCLMPNVKEFITV